MKKKPKTLVDKVADFQRLMETEEACEVMKVQVPLWIAWDTIRRRIKECERYRMEEESLGINRDIGSAAQPVQIGSQFEGYKIDGCWTYRGSNPDKLFFSRNWYAVTSVKENRWFDGLYMKSVTGGN